MNHRLHLLLVIGLALIVHLSYGQNSVGIGTNTPNANAVLHLVSPGGNQGFIVPQLTSAQRIATSFTDNLSMEVQGLLVFDTDDQLFYYWNGTHWVSLSAQTLSAGTGITIGTDGIISNSGDLDETNEIQDLTLEGNTLTITNNGSATSIDLTAYLDNTDSQTLDLSSDQLSISGGNSVDLSVLKDGTGSDDQTAAEVSVTAAGNLTSTNVQDALIEIQTDVDGFTDTDDQTLSFLSNSLSIADGNTVDLSGLIDDADADATNELQDLTLESDALTITNNASASTIDLSPYLDNTDSQTLDLSSDQLSISGGNSVDLSVLKDGTGSDDQTAAEVSVSAAGNLTSTNVQDALIEIQTEVDGFTDTDDQTLSFSSNSLSIADGNTVDLSGLIDDADADATNELQDLTLESDALTITNNASASTIDLSPYLDNTDSQTLDLSSDQLTISGGNSVDLSVLKDGTGSDDQTAAEVSVSAAGNLTSTNVQDALIEIQADVDGFTDTDDQTLSFSSNSLSIADGNTVDLSGLIDDADADVTNELQDLDLSDNVLTITGLASPTNIDLSPYLNNNTDNQTLTFDSRDATLQISDGNSVDLSSLSDGFEPNTDSQNLLFSDNLLSISGGSGSVDMSGYLDNTDEQTLSFNTSTNSLTILDGNSVDLSTLKDGTGTDNQTLSLATNTLSISGGNGISLASFKDNTDNQSLSYNDNSNQLTISGGNSVNLTRSAYQTLRPADFIPVTPEEGGVITIEITDNGNVGNFFADGSLDGQITADLELPHGATVESIAVHAARGSQSKNPIDVYLYSSEAGTVSPTIIESGQISSTAITELKLTPADLTIDNSRNVYYLVIDGEAGSTRNYYDRILHVVIAYSY